MSYSFPIIYWSKNATKVQFEPFAKLPGNAPITSCMVFVKQGNSMLLSRPERGWGLPGGHKEPQESPEECAIREVLEETGIEIKAPKLIGGWKAQKIKYTDANSKYPDVAYQLLFVAEVAHIRAFTPDFETLERKFVEYSNIATYHHNYTQFSEILKYIMDTAEDKEILL